MCVFDTCFEDHDVDGDTGYADDKDDEEEDMEPAELVDEGDLFELV